MSCSPKWPRRDVRLKRVGKLNWGWNNWFIWIFEHLFQFQEQWVRPGAKTFPSKHVHTKVRHLDIVFVIFKTMNRWRTKIHSALIQRSTLPRPQSLSLLMRTMLPCAHVVVAQYCQWSYSSGIGGVWMRTTIFHVTGMNEDSSLVRNLYTEHTNWRW